MDRSVSMSFEVKDKKAVKNFKKLLNYHRLRQENAHYQQNMFKMDT